MERSSFFNAVLSGETYDRVYTAEDYARYFGSFIGNGVFPTPSTNLQVVANGTTMDIILKGGKGWINGYFYENTEDLNLTIAVADGVLNRIDRVVLRLDFINREIKAYVKKGTFASSPVAPNLTRNYDMYELGIADIKVNKGVTKIAQANITDLRQNNTYCGLVAGVVQQIDTTNLFAQFQSTFDLWFEHVKCQLSTDVAGNLQNQIDQHSSSLVEKVNKTLSIFTPTLLNGWINYGQGYDAIKYWKDDFNVVHMQGAISSGTANLMFTLPTGYRPAGTIVTTVTSVNSTNTWDDTQVMIKSTGAVELYTGIVGKTHIFTVSFLAAA